MTALILKVLEPLAALVSIIKDGAQLISRRAKGQPAPSGWANPDVRLDRVRVLVDSITVRVSDEGGRLICDLRVVNPTRKPIHLDQVRVEYVRINSYPVIESAEFVPASGHADPKSLGLGRFEIAIPQARVKHFRSGLKVSPNRQSAPVCDIDGRAMFQFRVKNKDIRVEGELTRRPAYIQVDGVGPEGVL